ncbi:hypothetical protein AAF712_004349 [Marasmius tenuissimus]|uniref:Uncharacterized protein n=1 Tax=Marasmius tenuissimus TaxID=585030 RepID=A0ABR3A4W8_9AGAR
MKGLVLSAWILLSTLLANAAVPTCDPGWELVEDPPGNFFCRKTDITCPGTKRDYHDSVGGDLHCCTPSSRQLVIYDEANRVGVCCAAGKVYAGTAPNGLCCNPGQIVKDGKCADPPPPALPTGCPSQPSNACQLKKVCGNEKGTGLLFGSCYQISFPTLKYQQLGRGYGTNPHIYRMGGFVHNIPFKLCKTTTACGIGPVLPADLFYIQDQIGNLDDAASKKNWNNGITTTDPVYLSTTADVGTAGQFKAQTSCSGCKCVVSLTGATKGLSLINKREEDPVGIYGLTFTNNLKSFVDLQFTEIPCDNSVVFGFTGAAKSALLGAEAPLGVDAKQIPLLV